MKKLKSGEKLQLSLEPVRQDDGWWLILDDHLIEKYSCQFHVDGIDFSEFVRTGQKMLAFHDSYSQLPLGDWEYKVEGGKLWGKPHFASDIYPYAAVCEKMANTKSPVTGHYYMNAVSAGLMPLEIVEKTGDPIAQVTKSRLDEISMVIFGAHPNAGRGLMSMTLTAMADGTITEGEAELVADSAEEITNTEGATLRKELETLRADNARLTAELAAKGTPAPEPAAVVELDNPKPETLTREAVITAVRESRADIIAAAADRIYRRLTGKLPD